MPEINAATGEPQSPSGWSMDDPGAGAPALAPQSPLAMKREAATDKYVGQLEGLSEDQKKEFAAGEAETAPLRGKVLQMLQDPNVAKAHLEKVQDEPKPEDYRKNSLEFASAMAVMGALAGRFTRAGGTAALNAFSGALKGWNQGNQQAYEDAAKQWEAATKKTLDNNNIEIEKYKEIMADKKANIDQMMAAMNLVAAEHQNKIMFDATLEKNYTMAFGAVDKMYGAQEKLQGSFEKLQEVKAKQDEKNHSNAQWLASPEGQAYISTLPPGDQAKYQQFVREYGKGVDEQSVHSVAELIAANKMPPLSGYALRSPFGQAVMAEVQQINPNFSGAGYTGAQAGARTEANRAANLDIILNSAMAAIPQALDASAAVPRGQWVSVNKAIQAYQAGTSDPKLATFAVANLQIAELWARAMNPTGVMREGDRELALHNLSMATSPEAYKVVLGQVEQAIRREKGAVLQTEKERGTNNNPDAGSLTPPPAGGDDGWGQVKVQ
jgi:hypothetical protein